MKAIKIGNRVVGPEESTFIIAEAGSNHDRKLDQAKRLIDVAAKAKVDAVKFQIFSANKIVVETNTKKTHYEKVNTSESVYEIVQKAELPREWLPELMEYADKAGLLFLASTFDRECVDILDNLDIPAFKIASGELTNLPLLEYTARKNKPMIVSTGAATLGEIEEALSTIKKKGNIEIILLHCVSNYPAALEDLNLRVIPKLRDLFQLHVGFSDHTLGIYAPLAAVAMGASVIEKHFTLDKKLPGPDHFYALEPKELKSMVDGIRTVEKTLGLPVKHPVTLEWEVRKIANRSLYAAEEIPEGTRIDRNMLTVLRPLSGLEPKYLDLIVGRIAKKNIKKFEPITWEKM